jgi:hypothetical protein
VVPGANFGPDSREDSYRSNFIFILPNKPGTGSKGIGDAGTVITSPFFTDVYFQIFNS